jgi:hypothetical protein
MMRIVSNTSKTESKGTSLTAEERALTEVMHEREILYSSAYPPPTQLLKMDTPIY